jgi:pSer/pThr/pTyr-binding forkhead associated (FHA) protein
MRKTNVTSGPQSLLAAIDITVKRSSSSGQAGRIPNGAINGEAAGSSGKAVNDASIVLAHLKAEHNSEIFSLAADLMSVGSSPECNIVLNDPAVSRRHAMLRNVGGCWLVQDLGSTNGTWINGERISRPTQLEREHRIAFGPVRFVFRQEDRKAHSVLDDVLALSPFDFEKMVGELFKRLRFETLVTRQVADGGVDVVAVNHGLIFRGRYLIQCKRYNPSNRVSRPEIQTFHGRIAVEPRARGIFITTSSFTRGARRFAELTGINLIDGQELEKLIIRHRVLPASSSERGADGVKGREAE